MASHARVAAALILSLFATGVAGAEEEEEFRHVWSATVTGDAKAIDDRDDDDAIGGFFDQYEFTPNKSSSLPFELGIRDALYDLLGPANTPLLQFRLQSPTSNLGVSGSQVDEAFFDQHADLLGRFDGFAFDVAYDRLRTEKLRIFPEPSFGALPFQDLTSPEQRFQRDRTGFFAEGRLRPRELWNDAPEPARWLDAQLALRGGYEARDGTRQLRFLASGSNTWLALSQPLEHKVSKVGGRVLAAPGGLFTLTVDADHKRFRNDSPTLIDSQVSAIPAPTGRTLGFIPDTDHTAGSVRVQSRLGQRAVLEGGFQFARLKQVEDLTPMQVAAGLHDNELTYYSANTAADVAIGDRISANAFFKYDQRDNDLDRSTSLYSQGNGSQVDEFMRRWQRVLAGAESVWSVRPRNLVAVGARFEWVDRTLEFAAPSPGNRRILPDNALVAERTQMWTVYGRTSVRPARGFDVHGELGYRGAPDTGYIVDLDQYVYGKARASYVLSLSRPILFSVFVQGGHGENSDFVMVEGLGPYPNGALVERDYDRTDYLYGLTASASPLRDLTLFGSFFGTRNAQDYGLVLSNLQRYFQENAPLVFSRVGSPNYRDDRLSFVLGTHHQLSERTEAGISYSFTRVNARFRPDDPAYQALQQIATTSLVDSNIHGIQLEAGHWLREGLRVLIGYRLDLYDDQAPVPSGQGSVVPASDLSSDQHTITLGVTLTSELLARAAERTTSP